MCANIERLLKTYADQFGDVLKRGQAKYLKLTSLYDKSNEFG